MSTGVNKLFILINIERFPCICPLFYRFWCTWYQNL